MSAPGRYIRPAKTTFAPSCIVTVIAEEIPVDRHTSTGDTILVANRVHVMESHRRGHRWTEPVAMTFPDGSTLLDWLESTRSEGRRTYVFTEDVVDTFTLLDMWARIESRGCTIAKGQHESTITELSNIDAYGHVRAKADLSAVGSVETPGHYHFSVVAPGVNAQIIRYTTLDRTFQWCNFSQYCDCDIHAIARDLKYKWHAREDENSSDPNWIPQSWDRCFMWHRFMRALCRWWVEIDGGPWGSTTAACAYSFLRRRIQPNVLLHHNKEDAAALEELAIHGGRRSVWYYGNIGTMDTWSKYDGSSPERSEYGHVDSELINVDVRSMYPFLLANMPYPVELLRHLWEPSIEMLIDQLQDHCVIASVLLRTQFAEYPYKVDGRVAYPTGMFATVLCGAELMRAIGDGSVVEVYRAAIYKQGNPFGHACDMLLKLRGDYRDRGEDAWCLFVKQLSNSMTGKLAQKPHQWAACPEISAPVIWGQWTDTDTRSEEIRIFRTWAGMTWMQIQREACTRPMSSVYAYLTSYGRYYMSALRQMCPVGSVIAQDTDGIWCLPSAMPYLFPHREYGSTIAGTCHVDMRTAAARFYGPQHYWYGDGWVLSGIATQKYKPHASCIDVVERHNVALSSNSTPEPYVIERKVRKRFDRLQAYGTIDPDGWIVPEQIYTPSIG